MNRYLMYLRKSRMDTDFEEVSVEETLNRHRKILNAFCEANHYNVTEVLEEVVSGESLSARPKMMKLLELVNTGMYAGVICIDIERLSRGSSLESGYIMQIFQTNNCKIITPSKIYDLQNESDEQFTDMKFMFSRYELKTITKRLVRGRNQSASEGKFLGSIPPYGYEIYKLQGQKGNSLRVIPEQAKVVKMIYDMYGQQGIGYNTIAYQLNQMHIPSQTGTWGQTSITNILNNEVYLGKIRWRREPTKRIVKDGMIAKKRYANENYELHDGLHEAIITEEEWERVKAQQKSRGHSSVGKCKQLRNPFATLLVCEKCGAVMKRKVPDKSRTCIPRYSCPTRGCDCRMMKCDMVEEAIVKTMREWLAEYTIKVETDDLPKKDNIQVALSLVQEQLEDVQEQQDKICELLEKGVYTVDMFSKRNEMLEKKIKELKHSEADLLERSSAQKEQESKTAEIIPTTQHILDNYEHLSVVEKNNLWKIVMEKITVFRTQDGEFNLHIYPKLPM